MRAGELKIVPNTPILTLPGGIAVRRFLNFRMRREVWSRYEIRGYPMEVWHRHIALKIAEVDGAKNLDGSPVGKGAVLIMTLPVATVFSDPSYIQKPTEPELVARKVASAERQQLRWRTIEEPENEYLLIDAPERVVTTKSVVTRIDWLRGVHGQSGEPALDVRAQQITADPRLALPEELGA